jgi:SAM-dependent methyltransferase
MPPSNATSRFSDRVENYIRYRPGYPIDVIELLRRECGLSVGSVVADIGSGTGVLSRMLLEAGSSVFGIEPNDAMRHAAEELLSGHKKFRSIAGSAEASTLDSGSVDLITAAQAAHWFERGRARAEFIRILKPGGWCALIWNERQTDSTPFLRGYEELLLHFATDYEDVRHERTTATISEFFAPCRFVERVFHLRQEFDYKGLEGRLLSSSYAPTQGHPKHEPMLRELKRIFDAHARNGLVAFEYNTRVYYGRLE